MSDLIVYFGFVIYKALSALWAAARMILISPLMYLLRSSSRRNEQHSAVPVPAHVPAVQSHGVVRSQVAQNAVPQMMPSEAESPTVFLNDWEVADRIVSLRLDPPVASIHLRIYHAAAKVKREIIVSEPRLRTILGARRLDLPDAVYDPKVGLEDVKDESLRLTEDLINKRGQERVKGIKPPKADFPKTPQVAQRKQQQLPSPAASAPATGAPAPVAAPAPAAPPAPTVSASPPEASSVGAGSVVRASMQAGGVPLVQAGLTYEGDLVRSLVVKKQPRNRPAYEVFEAVLRLDNGAELPLAGAELERSLTNENCVVGDRVAITPMGKVPVTLANGAEGQKNLYKVRNLSRRV